MFKYLKYLKERLELETSEEERLKIQEEIQYLEKLFDEKDKFLPPIPKPDYVTQLKDLFEPFQE